MATHLYTTVMIEDIKTHVVGLFSNKKHLYESLDKICDLANCYIAGERKHKKVNHSTLSTSFINGFLIIYDIDTEEKKFMIWDLVINNINPELLNKN